MRASSPISQPTDHSRSDASLFSRTRCGRVTSCMQSMRRVLSKIVEYIKTSSLPGRKVPLYSTVLNAIEGHDRAERPTVPKYRELLRCRPQTRRKQVG